VKRLCADDSAATSVKVGYRQASYIENPAKLVPGGVFCFVLPIPLWLRITIFSYAACLSNIQGPSMWKRALKNVKSSST
jgi:hypothetical protein